jgi:hypothetical protein
MLPPSTCHRTYLAENISSYVIQKTSDRWPRRAVEDNKTTTHLINSKTSRARSGSFWKIRNRLLAWNNSTSTYGRRILSSTSIKPKGSIAYFSELPSFSGWERVRRSARYRHRHRRLQRIIPCRLTTKPLGVRGTMKVLRGLNPGFGRTKGAHWRERLFSTSIVRCAGNYRAIRAFTKARKSSICCGVIALFGIDIYRYGDKNSRNIDPVSLYLV